MTVSVGDNIPSGNLKRLEELTGEIAQNVFKPALKPQLAKEEEDEVLSETAAGRAIIKGFRRNPKDGTTFFSKEKKKILFKMSKKWTKKINEK